MSVGVVSADNKASQKVLTSLRGNGLVRGDPWALSLWSGVFFVLGFSFAGGDESPALARIHVELGKTNDRRSVGLVVSSA